MTYIETHKGIDIYGNGAACALHIFGRLTGPLGTLDDCRNIIDIDSQNMGEV
jgi:hypothetical protein